MNSGGRRDSFSEPLSSAGSFRAGSLQLWQIVFSKRGLTAAYRGVR